MSQMVRFVSGVFLFSGLLLLAFRPSDAVAQTQASISGFVRDTSGSALPGISLKLAENTSPTVALHATTDKLGAFRFDHLAMGVYTLSTDQPSDAVMPSGSIVLSGAASVVQLNLTLTHAGAASAKPPGLQLQAAGIRGYIDPGGYSAPAGAAAATKLIQGAADLNRADEGPHETAVSCEQGPALLKEALDHPDTAAAQRQLGEYYLATHQPGKALASLQRARILDEHDPGTLLSLGEALVQNRQFAAAHDLLIASAAGADKAAVHRLLARSDEGLGAFQQASLEYQAAAAMEPSEADFYGAGYELILAGSAPDAVKVFQSGSDRYPKSTTLLMGIGTAEFLLGQSAEATRIFLRCAALHPDDSRLYPFLSASFAISSVEPDAVEAAFRRYYELSPGSADAAYFYALVLLHRSAAGTNIKPSDAETLLQRAVQLEPGFAKAHLQLGSVYFDRGDFTHATEEFVTTLALDPGLWETRYRLSTAYRRAGRADLADQQMRLFLASKSQNAAGDSLSNAHIEQFLSVFARPSSRPGVDLPCAKQK